LATRVARSSCATPSSIPTTSRDRLDLALKAGVLELALDAVETIQGKNSLEKMLAQRDRRRPPGFIPPCQPVVAWGRQKTRRLRELKPAG
jgi:hypothetical protein